MSRPTLILGWAFDYKIYSNARMSKPDIHSEDIGALGFLFYFRPCQLYSPKYLEKRNTYARVIFLRVCTRGFRNPHIAQFWWKLRASFRMYTECWAPVLFDIPSTDTVSIMIRSGFARCMFARSKNARKHKHSFAGPIVSLLQFWYCISLLRIWGVVRSSKCPPAVISRTSKTRSGLRN